MSSRRHFIKGISAAAALPLLPNLTWAAIANDKAKDAHRVLCCNIRVALPEDEAKGVGWPQRKEICLKVIRKYEPDICCFQEVLKGQAEDIRNYFSKHTLFGFDGPEMDANPEGYHGIAKNPILFSNTRYELLAGGTYWLSQTPLVAGSKSWDTARARNAVWIRLRERKTGKEFRVVNTHLDHVSAVAKVEQTKMVVEESAQYPADFTQIFAGDFNSKFDSEVFTAVRDNGWKESYETLNGKKEVGFTTHEFEGVNYSKGADKGRIDFIWYKGKIKPVASGIIRDEVNGKFPSDHFFMQTDFITE